MTPKPKSAPTDTDPKTGTAEGAESGKMLPATGTAGATADATGADTLAADAGGPVDPVAVMDPDGRFTIIVQGPVAGRWRAGRHFTAEPTSIPARDLTFDQMAALRADTLLMISVIEAPY